MAFSIALSLLLLCEHEVDLTMVPIFMERLCLGPA